MKKFFVLFLFICAFVLGRFSAQTMLILPSPNCGGGIFFNVVNVLSFLRHCEKNRIKSFEVNYGDQGHYYDETLGENWWQYFFEPIFQETIGGKLLRILRLSKPSRVSQRQIAYFNYDGEYYLSRQKAYKLISKYIRVRPEIQAEIDRFKETHFAGYYVVGIHYRGTDKHTEADLVDYPLVKEGVDQLLQDYQEETYKIFVATDSQKFLDFITSCYPDKIITTNAMRSVDDSPLHYGVKSNKELYYYTQGKEAVIDALLLAHTDHLIRTSSNLSLCSLFFNPHLPFTELSKKRKMERQVDL